MDDESGFTEQAATNTGAEPTSGRPEGVPYRFNRAIVRTPGQSVVDGLSEAGLGPPSPEIFLAQHRAYVAALERAGLEVEILPALEDFPDSVFVEDTSLCLPEGAILLRPGAPSRSGEADAIAPALERNFREVHRLDPSGSVDGGDILVTDSAVLVGLSERTNRAGIESLKGLLGGWGYRTRAAAMPGDTLHFKSDCAVLDGDCVLASHRLAGNEAFESLRVLEIPAGEEAAANAIRVNDKVFIPEGFPRTAEMLAAAGYDVETLAISEAAKLDGGLSCMSLRFWQAP